MSHSRENAVEHHGESKMKQRYVLLDYCRKAFIPFLQKTLERFLYSLHASVVVCLPAPTLLVRLAHFESIITINRGKEQQTKKGSNFHTFNS
jgi:hypothetical protein